MVFHVARDHAVRLRILVQALTYALPAIAALILLSTDGNAVGLLLSIVTLMFAGVGVLFERWLFFAEAEHTVSLYYN
jgi:DMSO reductase anchor subunit